VAFGAALVTLMGRHPQLQLRVELGPNTREVTTPTLFVGNNRLQLEQVGVSQAPSLDEGCIAAVMLRPIGPLAMLGLMLRGALGTLGEADTVESFKFQHMLVKRRRAWGGRMVKVAFDGEVSRMPMPLDFRVSPKPLYLLKTTAQPAVADSGQGSA
jgi:diacylglycerol kinase family enzyme